LRFFQAIQSSVNVLTCNAEVDTGSIEQHLLFQTARLVFFFQLWHLPPIPTVLVPTLLLFFVVFCQYQLISARSVHLLELLCYPEPERQIACGSFELTLEYLHERASAQWSALLFPSGRHSVRSAYGVFCCFVDCASNLDYIIEDSRVNQPRFAHEGTTLAANASHTHGKIHVTGTRMSERSGHVLECRSSWFPLDWRTHLQHRVKTDRSQRLTVSRLARLINTQPRTLQESQTLAITSGQDHRHSTSSCLSSPQSKWSTCVLLSETNIGHDNPQGTTASGTQAVSGITTLPGIQASGTTAASGMTTLEAFKPSGTKPGLCCMSGTAIRKLPKRLQAEETGASRPLKLSSGPQKEVLQEGVEHQESSIFSSPVAQGQSQRFFATALLTFSSRFSRADRSTNTHSTGVLSGSHARREKRDVAKPERRGISSGVLNLPTIHCDNKMRDALATHKVKKMKTLDGEVEVETKQAAILVVQNYNEDYIADLRSITEHIWQKDGHTLCENPKLRMVQSV
ncbi:hypothetical protein KCU87_g183, partial [Aureobasidium melanogenum]